MADDFKMTFDIPLDLVEDVLSNKEEFREAWLWAIGEIFRIILQPAPEGIADFTGRTREAFSRALAELEDLGGPSVPSTYTPNPNYALEFLEKRKQYLEGYRGPPEDVEIDLDFNLIVTHFTLTIPDIVFQSQNYFGDPAHQNPQTPEPWDLVKKAEETVKPQLKDRLVEILKRRVRTRLKTKSKTIKE